MFFPFPNAVDLLFCSPRSPVPGNDFVLTPVDASAGLCAAPEAADLSLRCCSFTGLARLFVQAGRLLLACACLSYLVGFVQVPLHTFCMNFSVYFSVLCYFTWGILHEFLSDPIISFK